MKKVSQDLLKVEDDDSVIDLFNKEMNSNQESVRELFTEKNIKVKSDLDKHQISIIARLMFQSELTDLPELKQILDEFITLRVSKDRLSRKEFVDAHRIQQDNMQGSGLFNRFGQMFNRQG